MNLSLTTLCSAVGSLFSGISPSDLTFQNTLDSTTPPREVDSGSCCSSEKKSEIDRVWELYLKNFPECGLPKKFSRQKYKDENFSHSYFICDGKIFRQQHGKSFTRRDGVVVPADPTVTIDYNSEPKEKKPGYLAEGSCKVIYEIPNAKMGRSWTRNVCKRKIEGLEVLNHLPLLRQSPYTNAGYFLEYNNSKLEKKEMFLTEYMNGGDLVDLINQDYNPSPEELKAVALMMAKAVSFFYDNGLSHGDIKLENFMFHKERGREIEVRLGDIDFVRKVEDDLVMRWGSPNTVDPLVMLKKIKGRQIFKADVFSLGVCFYILFYRNVDYFYKYPVTKRPTRADFEENGFYTKPLDELGHQHLVWEMCDPDPEKRPTMTDVVARLEVMNFSL